MTQPALPVPPGTTVGSQDSAPPPISVTQAGTVPSNPTWPSPLLQREGCVWQVSTVLEEVLPPQVVTLDNTVMST